MTSHVTTMTLHSIWRTVHINFLHKTHRYMAQGVDPSASIISTLYVSVGVTGVSLNILRHKFNLNIFWKPPLLRCGRIVSLSCHTQSSSAAPFVRLWCCCCLFWGINVNCVAVTRKSAVFSRSILRTVPTFWRGKYYVNSYKQDDNHSQRSVMLRNDV
jgi:hypothetical protein